MQQRTCTTCGKALTQREYQRRGSRRFYCFDCGGLGRRAPRADDGTTASRITCKRDGCDTRLTGKQKLWCSGACEEIAAGRRRADAPPSRDCAVCGSIFRPRGHDGRYCSKRCRRRARNHAQRQREGRATIPLDAPLPSSFDCARCGKTCSIGENVAPHASRFCGNACKKRWHADTAAAEHLCASFTVEAARDRTAYRRALRADPCAYCGGPGGAIDHIQPRNAGGAVGTANLTGACQRCNSAKHTLPLLHALLWLPVSRDYHDLRRLIANAR